VLVLAAIPKIVKRLFGKAEPCTTHQSYDRFRDVTYIMLRVAEPFELGGWSVGSRPLYLYALTTYSGREMKEHPDRVSLGFSAPADSDLWREMVEKRLLLLVDGETRCDLGELCGLSDVDVAGPDAMEARWANMSLEDFKKIASATKVEVRLGALEFSFTDSHRECLRKFLDAITPLSVIRKPRRPPVPGLDDVEEPTDPGIPDGGPESVG